MLTRFPFQILKEQVLDLALIEDEGDVSVKLMMITQRPTFGLETSSKETLLQIRDYPSFCVLYELTVRNWAPLIFPGAERSLNCSRFLSFVVS